MAFGTQDETDEVMTEINMTPPVDVMLVLLIIFIITAPVMKHALNIDLPRASNVPQDVKPQRSRLACAASASLPSLSLRRSRGRQLRRRRSLLTQGRDTGAGDLRVFVRLDAADTHRAETVTVLGNGYAAFEHALEQRRAKKRLAPTVDHVL